MLSNTNQEIYDGFVNAEFMSCFPATNRFMSISARCRKPSGASYENVIYVSGCQPEELLFIDDKLSNIEGAEQAGIKGVLFNGQKDNISLLISQLAASGIIYS